MIDIERLRVWCAQVGGVKVECVCLGCHRVTISIKRYKGWEASHIRANSKGGNTELYNIFPLCGVCNNRMKTKNMFCYFYEMQNFKALRALITYVLSVVENSYTEMWNQCKGQMYHLAHILYVQKQINDGRIPSDHPVLKFFVSEDIKKQSAKCIETIEDFNKRKRVLDEMQKIQSDIIVAEHQSTPKEKKKKKKTHKTEKRQLVLPPLMNRKIRTCYNE